MTADQRLYLAIERAEKQASAATARCRALKVKALLAAGWHTIEVPSPCGRKPSLGYAEPTRKTVYRSVFDAYERLRYKRCPRVPKPCEPGRK